uniref:Uncharacterized protein n=1 Tax=Arundo donax TaxID=35708 RepID=A0A0A8YV95_ARUDO
MSSVQQDEVKDSCRTDLCRFITHLCISFCPCEPEREDIGHLNLT